jgi:hypothetical protein
VPLRDPIEIHHGMTEGFLALKSLVHTLLPISDAAMHMHVGLAVFWLMLVSIRDGRAIKWALVALLFLCGLNEAVDLHAKGSGSWRSSLKDTFNTMFWPCLLGYAISRIGITTGRQAEPPSRDPHARFRQARCDTT